MELSVLLSLLSLVAVASRMGSVTFRGDARPYRMGSGALASPYFLLAGEIRSAPSRPLLLRVILFYHAVTYGGEASSAPHLRVPMASGDPPVLFLSSSYLSL
jgi:hypothetical protein